MRSRISVIGIAAALALSMCSLSGCASTGNEMDPAAKIALETTVRIAVRHAVQDSPRALEKAQNIRNVVTKVKAITDADSTVAGVEAVVRAEVAKLQLSPLDRADAEDLISLLAVALESRFDDSEVKAKVVKVGQFLDLVLSALPPAPVST